MCQVGDDGLVVSGSVAGRPKLKLVSPLWGFWRSNVSPGLGFFWPCNHLECVTAPPTSNLSLNCLELAFDPGVVFCSMLSIYLPT